MRHLAARNRSDGKGSLLIKVMKQNRIVKASALLCLCTLGGSVFQDSGRQHLCSHRFDPGFEGVEQTTKLAPNWRMASRI